MYICCSNMQITARVWCADASDSGDGGSSVPVQGDASGTTPPSASGDSATELTMAEWSGLAPDQKASYWTGAGLTKTPENGGRNGAISQWPARARCALAFRNSRTVRGVSGVAVPNRRCLFGTKSSGVCGAGRRSGRPAGKIRPCRQLQLWLAAPPRPEWRERSRLCACRAHPLEPAAAAKRQRALAI